MCRNQVKLSPMGDIIGLDYNAVISVIKTYCKSYEVRQMFEDIVYCWGVEKEMEKYNG